MPGTRLLTAALAVLLVVGCGASTPLTTPGSSAAVTSVAPTPTPAPTEVPTVQPNPGATLSGIVFTDDPGIIALRVSEDGSSITSIRLVFMGLKCDGLSFSGMTMVQDRGTFPISGGRLDIVAPRLGKLTGEFTSPEDAAGSIELTLNLGQGDPIPCGTWKWAASQKQAPTPTPTPTEVPGIRPSPGATLSGPIEMGDKAKTAVITLQVSDDGSAITSLSGFFTDVKCDGFSAGSVMSRDGSTHPISGGELRLDSSSLGKLTGKFTSPTAVAGSIELTINPGIGSPIPCGTWDWSASQK